ncbi:PREDICTED: odorant receptor 22c-like [Polistes canadensis]|uniref:odorant receptor 22c-like n=1 Tax=Polistes canadensis TaxID=91411 RepID=UPI000718E988|nr:PREDICTED: odorant receptor 22c-like [Polistes canadensis]
MVNKWASIKNQNYKRDLNYSIELNRLLLKQIGVWPAPLNVSWMEIILYRIINVICTSLIGFLLISASLYILVDEKNMEMKLKTIGPISFCLMVLAKYWLFVIRKQNINRCVNHMENDWKNVKRESDRQIMIESALFGRRIVIVSGAFTYSGVFFYQVVLPLTSAKVVMGNYTFKPLAYPMSKIFVDARQSPANELMIPLECLCGFVMNAVTVGACSLAAVFALHACGQLKIMMSCLDNLVDGRPDEDDTINDRLTDIIQQHVRVLSFVAFTEELLQEISLVEVLGCTLNICLLGYNLIAGWDKGDMVSDLTYIALIISFAYNIFIFCYIGELLAEECKKVAEATYMIDWYRLQGKKSLALLLIIAMSSSSIKLTAGKFVELSISSFGDVIKASVAYLNMLRTVTT